MSFWKITLGVLKKKTSFVVLAFFAMLVLIFFVNCLASLGKSDSVHRMDYGWKVTVDGTTYEPQSLINFTFPKTLAINDTIELKNTLSSDLHFSSLRFKAYLATVDVFVENECIYSFGNSQYKQGSLVGSGFHFVPLPRRAAGKTITIRYIASEKAAFTGIPPIDILPISESFTDFYAEHCWDVLIAMFLSMLGGILIVLSIVALSFSRKYNRLLLIGSLSLLLGVWTMCNTKMQQIFSSNLGLNTFLEYITLYLAPIPLLLLIRKQTGVKDWKRKTLCGFIIVNIAFCIVSTILQVTNIAHYPAVLSFFHAYVFLCVVFLFSTKILHLTRGKTSERTLTFGILVLGLFGIADIVRFTIQKYLFPENQFLDSTWLPIGAFVFIILLLASYMVNMYSFILGKTEKDILTALAYNDSLTGLCNRAKCEKIFDALNESDKDFAIISIDMNGLKYVNDHFGHAEGDKMLVAFSKILAQAFENSGDVIRMGGDEFVVIIHDEDLSRIQGNLDTLKKLEAEVSVDKIVPLDVSYGIAYSNENKLLTADAIYRIADSRMYEMKAKTKAAKKTRT